MAYQLFLDDERQPPSHGGWLVVRNYDKAIEAMKKFGCPKFMSFDHDLGIDENGVEMTGKDVANWMINQHLDTGEFFPDDFDFCVHSQNSVGAENINSILRTYLDSLKYHPNEMHS